MVEELSFECLMPKFKKIYRTEISRLIDDKASQKITNAEFITKKF